MYKHSVPISISTLNDNIIDKLIDQLREGEFQRVLITVNGHLAREDSEIKLQYDKYAKYLKDRFSVLWLTEQYDPAVLASL